MTECRFDRERDVYLTDDGEYCDTPKREHCTARRTCSNHLGWGELTCARCLGRTRQDVRQIALLAALMLPEAIADGVNSEAATLAGPAGDPVYLMWRRIDASRTPGATIGDGKPEQDPTAVLGTWQAMLSEDYEHDLPDRITLATATAYIERNLSRVANDENQDFRLMAREIRQCRQRLEAVIHNSRTPERGAPCPTCRGLGRVVRLTREYSHWCDDEACERIHLATEDADVWRCPVDREHWWDVESYRKWVEERKAVAG